MYHLASASEQHGTALHKWLWSVLRSAVHPMQCHCEGRDSDSDW